MDSSHHLAATRLRIEQTIDEILGNHLDLILLLSAEQGTPIGRQLQQADALVRCLLGSDLQPTLFEQGRRIPMRVDTRPGGSLGALVLNAEMISRLGDEDLRALFTRPVAAIMGVAPVHVGLVLQGSDVARVRTLYHGAQRRMDTPVARATQVRAVIERRVTLFATRLRGLIAQLTGGQERIQLPPPHGLIEWLGQREGTWPEWADAMGQPFGAQTERMTERSIERAGATTTPPAHTLLELCWESLDLSPQSFMKHAARALRAQNLPVTKGLLSAIAHVIAPGRTRQIASIETWPSLTEVQAAWRALVRAEVETLGSAYHGEREVAALSAFDPPKESMGLREPEALPWEYPLVCWSVRETTALRDLLQGFLHDQRLSSALHHTIDPGFVERDLDGNASKLVHDEPMHTPPERLHTQIQVVGTNIPVPSDYKAITRRVYRAALATMAAQFEALSEAQRLGALRRIRGAYDGFFSNTRHVWERRLQGWQLDDPGEALERLATDVRHVLGCPVLFDPFESPDAEGLRPIPTFCFVVAIADHMERSPFHVPIRLIAATAAPGAPPLRVRLVHVGQDASAPCTWMQDELLTMETMHGQPVQLTLNAIEDDMLRMIGYPM